MWVDEALVDIQTIKASFFHGYVFHKPYLFVFKGTRSIIIHGKNFTHDDEQKREVI